MKRALILFLLLPCIASAGAARVIVPITQTVLPDQDIRYAVPVQIGGAPPLQALLDTGSTGLRIFTTALAAASYTDTGLFSLYAYGSGDRLSGHIGTAIVNIGDATTTDAIPFETVDQVGCMDFAPDCGAATLQPPDYGIGGDGIAGAGFQAILGVSLQPATGDGYTANPLAHIGDARWIIHLPEPGAAGPGALILNPDAADLAGFRMFPLNPAPNPGADQATSWMDILPACLNDTSLGQTICGPAILDTGSPGIIAYRPSVGSGALWEPGDDASLEFSTGGDTVASIPFATDRYAGSGLLEQPGGGPFTLVAGILPFFADDVLYDATAGAIGLRPRADAPDLRAEPEGNAPDDTQSEVIRMNAPGTGAPPKAGAMALPQVITP